MKLETTDLITDLYRWKRHWLDHIRALGYSKNTLALYDRCTERFIEYMREYQDDITLSGVTAVYFTGFLASLDEEAARRGKTVSRATKRAYLKALRGFFGYISDENDEFHTWERQFKRVRIAGAVRREEKVVYLTEEEVARLLSKLEERKKSGGYNGWRDALLVKLMLFGGLRTSEALGVRPSDFERIDKAWRVAINGKGGRAQFAYLAHDAIGEEVAYFAAAIGTSDLIMRTRTGKPLARENAYRIVNGIYREAGIFHKRGLHLLRHTFAMRLVKRGVDPVRIQKLLRHASIETTMVYAKAEESDAVEAVVG